MKPIQYKSLDVIYDWWLWVLRFCERTRNNGLAYIYDEKHETVWYIETFEDFCKWAYYTKGIKAY